MKVIDDGFDFYVVWRFGVGCEVVFWDYFGYRIDARGYIREGYYADLVLVDLNKEWKASNENTLYKCQWSPFENQIFKSKILKTFVNGNLVYDDGRFDESSRGKRLKFLKTR